MHTCKGKVQCLILRYTEGETAAGMGLQMPIDVGIYKAVYDNVKKKRNNECRKQAFQQKGIKGGVEGVENE